MGQSLSLCGARSRPSRSPSVCYMQADVEYSGGIAPLPSLPPAKQQQSLSAFMTRQQDMDGCSLSEAQQLTARRSTVSCSTLLVHDGSDSEDDDEEAATLRFSALLQRKDGAAQLLSGSQPPLSSFSSASSLSTSPAYPDNLAYYSTDDDSPLSSSSSSSLSAQQSPANLVPSSHRILVTPSTAAAPSAGSAPSSASSASAAALSPSSSSPPVQLSSSSSSHPFPAPYLPQRSLTASASSSSLAVRCHSAHADGQYAHASGFHHSRSHNCLSSSFLQHPTAAFPPSSQPRVIPTVHSSITLSASSSALSSSSSSPACPSAASCATTPETDCRPVITHNAVISIRPSCSNLAALVAADSTEAGAAPGSTCSSSSSSGRKFRSHRRPVALSADALLAPPTPAVIEDDSPMPTFSALCSPELLPLALRPSA